LREEQGRDNEVEDSEISEKK